MTRVDTQSLIPGLLVCGNRGLGVLGSEVPSTGDQGPGYLYNDLSLPADAGKQVRGLILTTPSAGTFFAYEDSSFYLEDAPDGTYTFTYRLYVDGADMGTATATLRIGVAGSVVDVPAYAYGLSFLAPVVVVAGGAGATVAPPVLGLSMAFFPPSVTAGAVGGATTVSNTPPWLTSFAGDTFAALFTNPLNTYANPIATYHSAGLSGLVSDTHDFGTLLTGDWVSAIDYTNVSGVAQPYLELSASGPESPTTISGATNATPIVLAITAHPYSSGDELEVSGVLGNTAANGMRIVTVVDANHVSLTDVFGNNVAGNGAYTSGGTAKRWVWQRFTGAAAKATARWARVRITTTGTLLVRDLGDVRCSVVAREERSTAFVTTSASAGTLVMLAGQYVAAQAVRIDAYGSTPIRTIADRVLVAPVSGLYFETTHAGGGNNYTYQKISTLGRTILSGDYLEYDVFIAASAAPTATGVGAFEIDFTDASTGRGLGLVDTNGNTIHGFGGGARGAWVHRKIALTAAVGKTASAWDVVCESDIAGLHSAVYANVQITDGAGTVRATLWASGEPTANTIDISSGASNVRCGPANSFLAYAFDSSGAQIATPVSWIFDGV